MMGGRNPDRPTSLLELQTVADADEMTNLKRMNKISSPERWEIKQVITLKKINIFLSVIKRYLKDYLNTVTDTL